MSEFSKKLKNEYDRARNAVLNAKKNTPNRLVLIRGVLLYTIVILLLTSKVIFVLIP